MQSLRDPYAPLRTSRPGEAHCWFGSQLRETPSRRRTAPPPRPDPPSTPLGQESSWPSRQGGAPKKKKSLSHFVATCTPIDARVIMVVRKPSRLPLEAVSVLCSRGSVQAKLPVLLSDGVNTFIMLALSFSSIHFFELSLLQLVETCSKNA